MENFQLGGLIIPLGFLAIFYFLVIKPQQKREKKTREMRNNLKTGDEIVTIGGVYGTILKIKDDTLTIEVGADKTKLIVAKWAVGNVTNEIKTK
ncbi:preprotein translocase, YajC subunit [Clostridium aceticum]|uniref:Preprotein translocase, YajC subunit n=1 Tax=Clostridium aceticum TaxID=84022 RepID=A0A0D8ICN6_9CLOT|nr:preprotein translocase subunit YajC [Clostridium aceticum]AKL95175.1 preprotein translocase, YajC subunit [Clostridium aceticum]KJF28048.1 preprotein translocase subunit YajC [Clostridium aceticum]